MRVVCSQGLRASKREGESGSKLKNWLNKDVCGETYLGDKEVMDGIQEELQLNNDDMHHLYTTVGKIPTRILYTDQIKQVIFDCGATSHSSGDKYDFKENTLTVLNNPIFMDGISGRLQATHTGTLHYEFREDNGFKEVLEAT